MLYWLALLFFAVGVLVPEMVTQGFWSFREDEVEVAFLLFFNGMLFLIFLWTDRTLRHQREDQRQVTQESRDTSKDLSKAYAHIGEMNRKMDIVMHAIVAMSQDKDESHHARAVCDAIDQALSSILRVDSCCVYVIHRAKSVVLQRSLGAVRLGEKDVKHLLDRETVHSYVLGGQQYIVRLRHNTEDDPIAIFVLCPMTLDHTTMDFGLLQSVVSAGAATLRV